MNIFRKIIDFLNKMKHIDIWGEKDAEQTKYSKSIKNQNPYGMISLVMSGFAFLFPQYGLSFLTLVFCILTYFTFDKEKEDNPWPFYLGIIISLIGIKMFITGEIHVVII
ncbi:cell division protein FtsK [Solibacillus sp. FSL W8-0474]|uniref:cell division protein FtsK n=1 Tax=Solibacillus sp. FSL W8-0474 TaxID=2975336 RepID=UPI0030F5A1C0